MLTTKRTDTYDIITYQCENEDGSFIDLTGSTVNFIMGKKNKLVTNASAQITSAINGIVQYQLTEADTLVSGQFLAEFEVVFPNGTKKTFPSNGYITVNIGENIDKTNVNVVVDMIAEKQGAFESKLNSILQQAGNINMSYVDEYSWTAADSQTTFVFPVTSSYSSSVKWFDVTAGNIPVDKSLVNRTSDNSFTLAVDPSLITSGITITAKWMQPIAPVTKSIYKDIPQQDLPPIDAVEGDLWFDTSDNEYQGTLFESLSNQLINKADKNDVRLMSVKLEQTDLSDTLLQQMAGNTPINSIPQDGSITPKKTDFFTIEKSINYLDINNVTLDYYIDSSGAIVSNTSYFVTDYIDVTQEIGRVLYFSYLAGSSRASQTIQRVATYDSSKIKTGQTGSNIANYTIPSGVTYIRVSLSKSRYPSNYAPMLEFDSLHSYVPYYNNAYLKDGLVKNYDNVSTVVNTIPQLKYSKNGDSFYIYLKSPKSTNYTRYTFSRYIASSFSLDYWRISDISIVDQYLSLLYAVCPNYEVECAIQIDTDSFTGGYHGYETTNNVEVYVNGYLLDLTQSTIPVTTATEIKCVVTSTVNRYGTTTPVFFHTKLDTFGDGKFKTYNRVKALMALTNVKIEMGLFSVEKMNGSTPIINRYNDNYNLISSATPPNGSPNSTIVSNPNITAIDIFGSSLVVRAKIGDNSKKNYNGILSDFGGRVKTYLRPVDNYNITLNEELYCNAEYVVYD